MTKICLPGAEAAGAINWLEHLNGHPDQSKAEWDYLESEKVLRASVLVGLSHSHGFYLQESHQVFRIKSNERYVCGSGRDRGRVSVVKYAQYILHTRDRLSMRKA